MKKIALLMTFLLAIMSSVASAGLLTFTHTGNGSGSLGGTQFNGLDFVITTTADTANCQSFSGGWWIENISASIWIDGMSTFAFLSPTREFVNNTFSIVGFSRTGINGSDLFDGPENMVFADWDMLGPIGPINGTGDLMQWTEFGTINTTGGVLVFANGECPTTYKVVPEPASLSLLALGALALICRTRS